MKEVPEKTPEEEVITKTPRVTEDSGNNVLMVAVIAGAIAAAATAGYLILKSRK